ncbi:hypothetical protein [Streptomyces sp. NPDC058155]|uniref:hypothetical protein n=1 Tax=Streptomyces sp. NPDC058155 TaxID=3346359 RepID=UPI0036EC6CE6
MLNTNEEITCEVLYEPGNYHFERRCEDCDAKYMSRMTLGQIEDRYLTGRISQDQFEAYMYIWATFSPNGSHPEWKATPSDAPVRRIARKLIKVRGFEIPAALIEPAGINARPPWDALGVREVA